MLERQRRRRVGTLSSALSIAHSHIFATFSILFLAGSVGKYDFAVTPAPSIDHPDEYPLVLHRLFNHAYSARKDYIHSPISSSSANFG